MVLTSKNGKVYNVLVWTAPIMTAAKKIIQVLVIFTNITEIRKLQDNLSSLGLMIGSVSHGIKGVLTGLDAGLYLFESGLKKNNKEQIEEGLEVSKLMVEHIRNLVFDILYHVKERKLIFERVDILGFAHDITSNIEQRIRREPIGLEYDFEPSLGEFEIDTSAIRPAFINIFENAIEACLDNKRKSSHVIQFRVGRDEKNVLFSISDNGIGMDQDQLKNIFTLFFSSKGNKGTGLGLYLADKTIRNHGGSIDVKTKPGKGTTFIIRLPLR
jgi:signal transduction histidine kinase